MITKESLSSVKGLKASGKVKNMLDSQWEKYVKLLGSFVDSFPATVKQLRADMATRSYGKLAGTLHGVADTLYKIHADDIAGDCTQHVNMIKRNELEHDEIEAFLENFIQSVNALSIDIQMAERKGVSRPAPAPQRKVPAARTSMRPLILAVDNAVMFLNTLRKLLKDAPYDLECCETADAAMKFLAGNRPDIILLDVEMPDTDGYSLARKIKSSGQKAPILFITAHSDREYVDKAVEVGAAGLLVKPLRIKQLLEKLEEFI